jgi:signal transduction histidine kinase
VNQERAHPVVFEDDSPDSRSVHGKRRWLELLLDVALIANEAESLDSALRTAMSRVCRQNDWYAAYCHVPELLRDVWSVGAAARLAGVEIDAQSRELARQWALQVLRVGETQHIDDFRTFCPSDFQLPGSAPNAGGAIATPLMVGSRSMGAMVFLSHHRLSADLDRQQLAELLGVIDSIGTQMGRVVERWHLARWIAEETEQEREALGRQIHDGVAQQLVGVKLLAQNLRKRMRGSVESFSDQWDLLMQSLVQAQAEARALARGLSAGAILSSSDTLVGQLEEIQEIVETGHGVACDLEVQGTINLPNELSRAHLVRIAREAVMNALRHAQPSRIQIRVSGKGEQVVLEVRDDGSGLPPEAASSGGMGLIGMRYRAAAVGGQLELESVPGKGTVIRCLL